MGQFLSIIMRCVCCEMEERSEKPSEQNPPTSGSCSHNSIVSLHEDDADIDVVDVQVSSPMLDFESSSSSGTREKRGDGGVKEAEIRWIKHYCSSHKILLVGEGDFSFSASLALAFGSATNMVATSLDSRGFLCRNYRNAMSNIHELRSRGCKVLHDVDATEMGQHCSLNGMKFDRIIYNFPHAGFFANEPSDSQKRRHRMLIFLFLENAKEMMYEDGEIHVTHKSKGFFREWKLEDLAWVVGLRLIQEVPFNFQDYDGYHTKYGFGGDKNFNCNPCKTYIFVLLQ